MNDRYLGGGVAGKHEPSSAASFYVSLATATLRGLLVVAALVLGVFVLSRAFPTVGSTPPPPRGPTTGTAPSPSPDGEEASGQQGGQRGGEDGCPRPRRFSIQVLNGTGVAGLAGETAEKLADLGYQIPLDAANANQNYDTTLIYAKKRAGTAAECLKQEVFPDAQIEDAAPDLEVDMTVIVGADYAEQQEKN